MAPIGSVWATDSWLDDAWEDGSWADTEPEVPFSGTPVTLHAYETWTLLHAAAPAGTGNTVTRLYHLTDESGNRLTDQNGNYLVAYTTSTTMLLHAEATETLLHG